MLDINLFREEKGGNPEIVRQSQRARYDRVEDVDDVIELDKAWRVALQAWEAAKKAGGAIQRRITEFRKKKEEVPAELTAEKTANDASIATLDAARDAAAKARDSLLVTIGNIVHESVPFNNDEEFNAEVVNTCGELNSTPAERPGLFNHVDLCRMLDIMDTERGTLIAGGRGYFLKNEGVMLNQAMQSMACALLCSRGSTLLQTPFFMKKDMMAQCAQLSEFHEALYKVVEKEGDEDSVKYLIATSEQPLACFHANESIDTKKYPMKYAGLSTCFRKEAGKHGKDTGGIFRTHQFEKVEQFVYCSPESSWDEMELMIQNSMDFYDSLEVPFRVVNIVSGELNNAAAKKYDLEGWFPGADGGGTWRELVSCSNCLDYQSRRLNTRYGSAGGSPNCHMLNSTLTACERTMCCLIENYQNLEKGGLDIPEPLRPYLGGRDFLPFKYSINKKDKLVPYDGPGAGAGACADK
jgi:seryl-tRNA synthetase